jgi:hypothetical protein
MQAESHWQIDSAGHQSIPRTLYAEQPADHAKCGRETFRSS